MNEYSPQFLERLTDGECEVVEGGDSPFDDQDYIVEGETDADFDEGPEDDDAGDEDEDI
jgi:hypothetical protein